jgi:copper chaperone
MKNTTTILLLATTASFIGCESPQATTPPAVVVASATSNDGITATLWVNGIGCPGCIPSVEEPMMKLGGVQDVSIELQTGVVTVTLNESSPATQEELASAIEDGGFTLIKIEMPQ